MKLEKQMADTVRKYVEGQKNLWRQVPVLALEAYGRTRSNDLLECAYLLLIWRFPHPANRFGLSVDLRYGRLCYWNGALSGGMPLVDYNVRDNHLVSMAGSHDALDAKSVVEGLKDMLKMPDLSDQLTPPRVSDWRKEFVTHINLQLAVHK